jgi:hypothetical protein
MNAIIGFVAGGPSSTMNHQNNGPLLTVGWNVGWIKKISTVHRLRMLTVNDIRFRFYPDERTRGCFACQASIRDKKSQDT